MFKNNFYFITHMLLNFLSNATQPPLNLVAEQMRHISDDWFKQFCKSHKTATYTLWHSHYKDPVANGLIQLTVSKASEVIDIADELVVHAQQHKTPLYWVINANDEIAYISQILADKGFYEDTGYVMYHDLQAIEQRSMPDLEIKLVEKDEIDTWLHLLNEAFNEYDSALTQKYAHVIQCDIRMKKESYYIGYLDTKPVVIGRLFNYPTYSYIASIATDRAYRRRGIASCMVTHLLKIAQQNGSHHVLLEAGSAIPVYEKIGFKKIMKLHEFLFLPISLKVKRRPESRLLWCNA